MYVTFWPSLTATQGASADITWEDFRAFIAEATVNPVRGSLQGWSAARFKGNQRGIAFLEEVSAVVLDIDRGGKTLEQLRDVFAGVEGVVHSSHSHDPSSGLYKWRVVLRTSQAMTRDEYARVWSVVAAQAAARGVDLDLSTKDGSRFWFAPARRSAEAVYEWCDLAGVPLNVDAVLALPLPAPVGVIPSSPTTPSSGTRLDRALKAAPMLGAAWPATGRHGAQLALAGALRSEGFTAEEALEVLCATCRAAGDEDRTKRVATINHTYDRPADAPTTGWTRLAHHVDGAILDAARGLIGKGADFERLVAAKRAAAEARREAPAPSPAETAPDDPHHVAIDGFVFRKGGWDEPLARPTYVVEGLIVQGSTTLFVAHGNSLKSMTSISICAAIARGVAWLGRFPTLKGPAVIADYERSPYEARRRVKLLRVADGLSDFMHCANPPFAADDPRFWETMYKLGPRFLTVDSLSAGRAGDESENETSAANGLKLAKKFSNATEATSLFIHHKRKGSGGDARESVRGSTAIFAAVDAVFEFIPIEAPEGVKRMRVVCTKFNLGPEPAPFAVELSDERGLVFYEEPAEPVEEPSTEAKIRARALEILRGQPTGVARSDLQAMLKGKTDSRKRVVAGLVSENLVRTFRQGRGDILVLNTSP